MRRPAVCRPAVCRPAVRRSAAADPRFADPRMPTRGSPTRGWPIRDLLIRDCMILGSRRILAIAGSAGPRSVEPGSAGPDSWGRSQEPKRSRGSAAAAWTATGNREPAPSDRGAPSGRRPRLGRSRGPAGRGGQPGPRHDGLLSNSDPLSQTDPLARTDPLGMTDPLGPTALRSNRAEHPAAPGQPGPSAPAGPDGAHPSGIADPLRLIDPRRSEVLRQAGQRSAPALPPGTSRQPVRRARQPGNGHLAPSRREHQVRAPADSAPA